VLLQTISLNGKEMNWRTISITAFIALITLVVIPAFAAAPRYAVIDLGTLGVTAEQVNMEQPLLLSPGRIEAMNQYAVETNVHGTIITTIFAVFDKERLLEAVPENGEAELRVTGRLKTGWLFSAATTIMIID